MNIRTIRLDHPRFPKRMAWMIPFALLPTLLLAQEETFSLDDMAATGPADADVARRPDDIGHRNEIEIGLGSVSDASFRFGKYNGLETDGIFSVLRFDLDRRGPYDGDSADYWRLTGSDIGLQSLSLQYEQGTQGDYRAWLEYDQLPVMRSDASQTIFNGAGGTDLTLPSGWVAGTNTAGMTQLLPALQDVDIDHERRRFRMGFDKLFASRWDVKTDYRHETKEGLKTVGGVVGNSGGNPRAVILPEPLDYVTQNFDVALGYAGPEKQFQLGYSLSLFNDNNQSLTWQNPYSAISGWDAAAGFPTGEGRLGLPPDNQSHQINASGGYRISGNMRLTADMALGRMTQNEKFLPYTVNPVLTAGVTQPLPRDSLDGRIDTLVANLRLAARPTPAFHWSASLRRDDRDNKTPRDEYVYIGGDSQTQNTAADSNRRRFNEPYSYVRDQLRIDAGHKIFRRAEITAGYERDETGRTFSEREEQTEDIYRMGLQGNLFSTLSAGARLEHADRKGSPYMGEEPFLSGYSPGYTATVPGGWENHPDLRKYFLADRIQDKAILFATWMPAQKITLGLNANHTRDDYDHSDMGLVMGRNNSYTLDAACVFSETMTAYVFYTWEALRSNQDGRQFNTLSPGKLVQAADPARDWFVVHHDEMDTVGVGAKKSFANKKLDIGVDYLHADSRAAVSVATGSALMAAPLPDVVARLDTLGLYGTWQLQGDLSIKARYLLERYHSADWAVDDVEPNTLANVITVDTSNPDYSVWVFALSLAWRF